MITRSVTIPSLVLALACALAGLARADSPVLISTLDGITVTEAEMLAEARMRRVPEQALMEALRKPDNVRRLAANVYVRRKMAQLAMQEGLDKDPEIAAQLNLSREKLLSDQRLFRSLEAPIDETALETMARHEYETNKIKYSQPETVRARHILITDPDKEKARARAAELLAQIKGGLDFIQLAATHSADPGSKKKGGDLGFFARGSMVKPFEDAAFALKNPGDLSDVVETEFGFHILRLEERREAKLKPYDEVKADVRQQVVNRVKAERQRAMIQPIEREITFVDAEIEALATRHAK